MTTLSTGEPWSIRRTDELHRVSNKRTVWSYEPIYTLCSSIDNFRSWNICPNILSLCTVTITSTVFFTNITVAEYTKRERAWMQGSKGVAEGKVKGTRGCVQHLIVDTPLRHSGMTHVLKQSHSFNCTPHIHLLTEWTKLVLLWWTEPKPWCFATFTCRRHRDVLGLKRHGVCAFWFFPSVHYVYYFLPWC